MIESQSTLTPEQIGPIHQGLLRTLAKLERSMKSNGATGHSTELDQSCIGRLSRIEALQNRGLTHSLQERERVQLAEVLDALRRIEEGNYGICTSCRESIPFERLTIFPETRTCAGCGTRA